MSDEIAIQLLPDEALELPSEDSGVKLKMSDAVINEKYVKGDIRIVTEQARYPINTVAAMAESDSYTLSPEYQRRHRWSRDQQSRLIESLIMNVPIPPVFLYEYDYSKYEVMDGLQRLTAVSEYYKNEFSLSGLSEWPELNGKKYRELPDKVREGIDRRYISSIILLKETARNDTEALRLKQLVFERLNSGGVRLSHQESRNALFNGPLNEACLRLSRTPAFCRLWNIAEPTEDEVQARAERKDYTLPSELIGNEDFRSMYDVELVLRFFANRQRLQVRQSGDSLKRFLDRYLQLGNASFSDVTISSLSTIFIDTINLIEDVLGEQAFWLYRKRGKEGSETWNWLQRATLAAYEPLMFVFSTLTYRAMDLRAAAPAIRDGLPEFYKKNYEIFGGRNVNAADLTAREQAYRAYLLENIA
ncbi:DUF262 domain-containing protein [Tabrizicola aquatica]|uniref:DUF262 domain-containing protein n=1 Tax=Tabrizicola aquatica TaxID=909926 RepID=UPI000CD30FA7|nr:DUF262 domain-containing protein [Tabrizicola aquatica]